MREPFIFAGALVAIAAHVAVMVLALADGTFSALHVTTLLLLVAMTALTTEIA